LFVLPIYLPIHSDEGLFGRVGWPVHSNGNHDENGEEGAAFVWHENFAAAEHGLDAIDDTSNTDLSLSFDFVEVDLSFSYSFDF